MSLLPSVRLGAPVAERTLTACDADPRELTSCAGSDRELSGCSDCPWGGQVLSLGTHTSCGGSETRDYADVLYAPSSDAEAKLIHVTATGLAHQMRSPIPQVDWADAFTGMNVLNNGWSQHIAGTLLLRMKTPLNCQNTATCVRPWSGSVILQVAYLASFPEQNPISLRLTGGANTMPASGVVSSCRDIDSYPLATSVSELRDLLVSMPAIERTGVQACDHVNGELFYPQALAIPLCRITTALARTPLLFTLSVKRAQGGFTNQPPAVVMFSRERAPAPGGGIYWQNGGTLRLSLVGPSGPTIASPCVDVSPVTVTSTHPGFSVQGVADRFRSFVAVEMGTLKYEYFKVLNVVAA